MSVHDHDDFCRPPRMFTQHGCADCNLIRDVREDERGKVIDQAIAALMALRDYTSNPEAWVELDDAVRRVEAITDSPPADPAEGTGSAGRGQEAS